MRFRVRERRAYVAEYLIEARDYDAAWGLSGEILEEHAGDSYAVQLLDVTPLVEEDKG